MLRACPYIWCCTVVVSDLHTVGYMQSFIPTSDLTNNKLIGTIPSNFSQLTQLYALYVSRAVCLFAYPSTSYCASCGGRLCFTCFRELAGNWITGKVPICYPGAPAMSGGFTLQNNCFCGSGETTQCNEQISDPRWRPTCREATMCASKNPTGPSPPEPPSAQPPVPNPGPPSTSPPEPVPGPNPGPPSTSPPEPVPGPNADPPSTSPRTSPRGQAGPPGSETTPIPPPTSSSIGFIIGILALVCVLTALGGLFAWKMCKRGKGESGGGGGDWTKGAQMDSMLKKMKNENPDNQWDNDGNY